MKSFLAAFTLRFLLAALPVAAGLLTTACKKEDTRSDDQIIKDYISSTGAQNVQQLPSGLHYVPITTNPSGVRAVAGKTVSVLYTGRLMDGTVFDATSKRNNVPFDFVLGAGQVIRGWDEGIALMRKGEKGELLIPSALGYGSRGAGASIPPNAVLRFEVEVTDVK